MRPRTLIALLSVCGVLAIYPAIVWLLAWTFDGIDDRWRELLGLTSFTVPTALGLAAIILVTHGILIHQTFQAEAEEAYEELRERQLASVGAGPGDMGDAGDGGVSVSASRTATSRSARPPVEPRSKKDQMKRRASSMARRKLRQSSRWIS